MCVAICDDIPTDAGLIRFALEDLADDLRFDCYTKASDLLR